MAYMLTNQLRRMALTHSAHCRLLSSRYIAIPTRAHRECHLPLTACVWPACAGAHCMVAPPVRSSGRLQSPSPSESRRRSAQTMQPLCVHTVNGDEPVEAVTRATRKIMSAARQA